MDLKDDGEDLMGYAQDYRAATPNHRAYELQPGPLSTAKQRPGSPESKGLAQYCPR